MNGQSVVARKAGAESTRLGADFVVLDPQGRTLRGLNGTGARVFELSDGQRTVAGIAAEISREFRITAERALQDVLQFVELLCARGLLEERAASPSLSGVSR